MIRLPKHPLFSLTKVLIKSWPLTPFFSNPITNNQETINQVSIDIWSKSTSLSESSSSLLCQEFTAVFGPAHPAPSLSYLSPTSPLNGVYSPYWLAPILSKSGPVLVGRHTGSGSRRTCTHCKDTRQLTVLRILPSVALLWPRHPHFNKHFPPPSQKISPPVYVYCSSEAIM